MNEPRPKTPEPLWQRLARAEDAEAIALLLILAGLAVALVGLALYFWVYLPYRRRKPLREALEIILRQDTDAYGRAEELLSRALEAGLRRADVAEARFALAYVRAQLGRFAEAAGVLSELVSAARPEPEVVYLYLWLQSKLKDQDKVERVYEQHGEALGDLLDTKLIAGIAYLHRARQAWTEKAVDGALHYFNRLRKLGVLTEEIPKHIDQHQVVLGIMALFDGKLDEARKHFDGAVKSAQGDNQPTVPGRLGLLLCAWRGADVPDVDEELAALIEELPGARAVLAGEPVPESFQVLCPSCGARYKVKRDMVGKKVACRGCKTSFAVEAPAPAALAGSPAAKKAELEGDALLLRNTLLLHAVSLLYTWLRLPAKAGLPDGPRRTFRERLRRTRKVDPSLGDCHLLEGLIAYYFARNDAERTDAVQCLERAAKADVNVPEVLDLLQREQKLADVRRNMLTLFLDLVRKYLTDFAVPEPLRRELRDHLAGRRGLADLAKVDLKHGEDQTAPSVQDLQNRGGLIHRRVKTIVQPRLAEAEVDPAEQEAITKEMTTLDAATRTLTENVERLEQAEMKLLERTGEFLFDDEPPAEPAPAAAKKEGK
jgi:tetratricopeptide (TPR) repeat protein